MTLVLILAVSLLDSVARNGCAANPVGLRILSDRILVSSKYTRAFVTFQPPPKSMSSKGGKPASTSGNSSSIGPNMAISSKAQSKAAAVPLFGRSGTSSKISQLPSRCINAWVPGNSNSLGMRTAWLAPFRRSFTALAPVDTGFCAMVSEVL